MTKDQSIDSRGALCRKLMRSFGRRLAYGEYQLDWVFDIAVTAWHLVDWVARETNADLQTTQAHFRKKCSELAVCEQICNGVKHLVLHNPALRPFDVTKDVRARDARVGKSIAGKAGEDNFDIALTTEVLVSDKDGNTWQAVDLFEKVVSFWEQEMGL